MYWLVAFMSLLVVALVVTGLVLELHPLDRPRPWFRPALLGNFALFALAEVLLLALGAREAMAAVEQGAAATGDISTGLGLALLGIGIPTGLAAIGAGVAVGPIGAASLAVLAEKPDFFGRTLIYVGLGEGIAIYGLVMSILLLGKI